jgi:hypothetical protein
VSKTSETGISGRKVAAGAAFVAGIAAIGAGLFLAKDKSAQKSDYEVQVADGAFEIRHYPPLLLAETLVTDAQDRKQALDKGFGMLADYIFAKSRKGEKIAMTAPVLSNYQQGATTRSGEARDGWRVRFIMPRTHTRESLPPAPAGIDITELSSRRVAVVRFAGLVSDKVLAEQEDALRHWLGARGEAKWGEAEYGFYDAPFIPGPLRRNEVLVPLG